MMIIIIITNIFQDNDFPIAFVSTDTGFVSSSFATVTSSPVRFAAVEISSMWISIILSILDLLCGFSHSLVHFCYWIRGGASTPISWLMTFGLVPYNVWVICFTTGKSFDCTIMKTRSLLIQVAYVSELRNHTYSWMYYPI